MSDSEVWYAIAVTVEPHVSEAIEFAFNNLGSQGSEIDSLRKSEGEDVSVVGYFDVEKDQLKVHTELAFALKVFGFVIEDLKGIEFKEFENQDWLSEWKKHWKPTEIGQFVIAPAWEELQKTKKHVIRIDPNMAFGTGTHETTQLCLSAIEEHYLPEMSFFDVGTGTGILSIAVSKLLGGIPGKVTACDVDVDSIKIAKENAELNDAPEIEFYEGSISAQTDRYDFVCANVTADIIIPMLPVLKEKSRRFMLLSGILIEQENEIRNELSKLGIENAVTTTLGEWISLAINRV